METFHQSHRLFIKGGWEISQLAIFASMWDSEAMIVEGTEQEMSRKEEVPFAAETAFTERVRSLLLAQPLNHLEKVEIRNRHEHRAKSDK